MQYLYRSSLQIDPRYIDISRSQVLPNSLTKPIYPIRAGNAAIQVVENPARGAISGGTVREMEQENLQMHRVDTWKLNPLYPPAGVTLEPIVAK